jgi:predicted nucleic acid-binding protein
MATSEDTRGRRLRTLQAAQSTYAALDVDEAVAASFAELVATARKAGRRPKVQDAWIAATAHAHRVAVYSQDADFDDLAINVVRV